MDCAIAGGAESMTMVPMTGLKFSPNPYLAAEWPGAYLGMGLTAENVADKCGITRSDQDMFAYSTQRKANRAVESGLFDPEIVPVQVDLVEYGRSGNIQKNSFIFKRDEGPRADTTVNALAKLKPAFKEGGSVTAGNSSQMSDGAAAVMIVSREKAENIGIKPLVRFVAFAVGGVEPEYMGLGPIIAIPKALKLAGLKLEEISLIELNEAFASQSL